MSIAFWFMLIWLVLLTANFVSWMTALSSGAEASARFLYYPTSSIGRFLGYALVAAVVIGSLSAILGQELPMAARLGYFLFPYAVYSALALGSSYSLWRRYSQRPNQAMQRSADHHAV